MNKSDEMQAVDNDRPQSDDAVAREEAYRRMNQLLAELEMSHQESFLGRLSRSKSFWYAVFSTLFFAFMGALLYWVYLDLNR